MRDWRFGKEGLFWTRGKSRVGVFVTSERKPGEIRIGDSVKLNAEGNRQFRNWAQIHRTFLVTDLTEDVLISQCGHQVPLQYAQVLYTKEEIERYGSERYFQEGDLVFTSLYSEVHRVLAFDENSTEMDKKGSVRITPLALPPENAGGFLYQWHRCQLASIRPPKEKGTFSVGEQIVLRDCQAFGELARLRGIIYETGTDSRGRTRHNAVISGRGHGWFYPEEIAPDMAALQPDAKGHIHKWEVFWNGTYRVCACGRKEWALSCWTGHDWQKTTPGSQLEEHVSLQAAKIEAGSLTGWTSEPFRTRSYEVIPEGILNNKIFIIGAGSIGSFTAISLMKMGFRHLYAWDPDVVSVENVGTQAYGNSHIGMAKVDALGKILEDLGPEGYAGYQGFDDVWKDIDNSHEEDEEDEEPDVPDWISGGAIAILAVDSMAARKSIWKSIQDHNRSCGIRQEIRWVIDGRMGAENALLFVIDPSDRKDTDSYQKTLYSDETAVQEPCTARGTVYTANLISGAICKAVKDVLTYNMKYSRVMQWNIADNAQVVYHKKIEVFTPQKQVESGEYQELAIPHADAPYFITTEYAPPAAQELVRHRIRGGWQQPENEHMELVAAVARLRALNTEALHAPHLDAPPEQP